MTPGTTIAVARPNADPKFDAPHNPLLSLTPTLLHLITGDRRQQLISYLKHWEQQATLLRYLDTWLAVTPTLATLRQARAETLLALGQPQTTLTELDAIDAERGVTTSRRQLRFAALLAMEDWGTAEALSAGLGEHGDLLMAQGRFDEARRVYAELGALREGPPTAREIRAALASGESERARLLLRERRAARDGASVSVGELRLEAAVVAVLGDDRAIGEVDTALETLELTEREHLIGLLGLANQPSLEVVPDVPALEPSVEAVPPAVIDTLKEHWGYDHLRGGQSATIARVLNQSSVLAVLPTGAGKSLTYQLPALLLDGITVVVSPLIALMKDQLDGLPPAIREQAVAINSSMTGAEVTRRLQEVRAGRYKLVYVAPERLRQRAFVHALHGTGIARFVVDEAHCVSLWGLSFRPDYLFLRRVLATLEEPPVLALTATATPETRLEITEQLGTLDLVAASVFRRNLHFSVVQVPNAEQKTVALVDLCREIRGPMLIYARSRERCEELAHLLRRKGIKAGHYHAHVDDRKRAQEDFMNGEVRVLVATVAFGMGIDKPDIRAIIHYNLPQSVEAYYQEAGRAGRDGEPSRCVLLYTPSDKAQLTSWLRQDTLDRDHLRAVYRSIRAHAHNGYALIAPEMLQRDVGELDETSLRVALGMLERVELVVRHFDMARTFRVTMLATSENETWQQFVDGAELQLQRPRLIAPLPLAEALGIPLDQFETTLLQWSAAGLLQVDSGPRDWLLELLPAPADTPARIESMLREYSTRQDARVDAMVGYAKGLSCRHQALAAHFGERLGRCEDACDVCMGDAETSRHRTTAARHNAISPRDEDAATTVALRVVRDLPFSVGRTGVVRILNGSVESSIGPDRCPDWGALQSWTKTATGRLIDGLIEQRLLDRVENGPYPLLELTAKGRQVLQEAEGQQGSTT